jgi:eukaryotic-like serine/threonine-protein kinase
MADRILTSRNISDELMAPYPVREPARLVTPSLVPRTGGEFGSMPLDAPKPILQSIGNYEILAKLADGGMGSVYKGRHRETGVLVAIKTVPSTTARNPVLLKRFEQEFRAASVLDHPNVVKALEYNDAPPNPFLVMEFVDGDSLGQKIEREGPIPEVEAIRLIAQVCQGLHRAHKHGLIHRDVKPDNIMVTRDGIAKLTDLGLVKDLEGELNLTRTGRGLGTPHFMAPEQFRDAKNADIRCDIYSLGATLYMMVTGSVPFGKVGPLDCWMKKIRNDFVAPKEAKADLSNRIDWAIRRAMSGDPEKRPTSCREFVEDLHGTSIRPIPSGVHKLTDLWYLVYKDEQDETHTVKGNTEAIRRALGEGLLGDASNIRASRTKQGPFNPLEGFPEFRDLLVTPSAMPQAAATTSKGYPSSSTRNVAAPQTNDNGGQRTTPTPVKALTHQDLQPGPTTTHASHRPYIPMIGGTNNHVPLSVKETKGDSIIWTAVLVLGAAAAGVGLYLLLPRLLG